MHNNEATTFLAALLPPFSPLLTTDEADSTEPLKMAMQLL